MEGPDWKKNCLWAEPKLVCREDLELIKLEQATKFCISAATLFLALPGVYTLSLITTSVLSDKIKEKKYFFLCKTLEKLVYSEGLLVYFNCLFFITLKFIFF